MKSPEIKTSEPVCMICFSPANNPKRRVVNNEIVEGCISAFHTGHLPENTITSYWHNRESAKSFRRSARFDFNPKTGYWVK